MAARIGMRIRSDMPLFNIINDNIKGKEITINGLKQ